MILGAIGDTPYNIFLLLHLVTVILGVGAAFLGPIGSVRAGRSGASTTVLDDLIAATMAPSLLLAGVFGSGLVGFSGDQLDFADTWLAIAGPLWIAITVAAAFVATPSYLRLPTLSESRKAMVGGILHLLLAFMLIIMVWQPGA